jgi:nucleoside-diphosphate-sugar epimerase
MSTLVTITGATGLIGTALRDALATRGIRFRALVRTPQRARTVDGADAVVVGCVSDPRAVAEACAGSDAIVHLARSTHQVEDLCRYDYPAMHAVIAAANANAARLHFTSSQAVFGGTRAYPPPMLRDTTPPQPSTAYGAMKAAWEWTARAACTLPPVVYRLPVVVPARLADAPLWLKYLLLIGFCDADLDGRTLTVRPRDARFAHGGVSFVHVEDVAETIAANLCRPEAGGAVAMLADAEYVPFRDLADRYAGVARDHGLAVRTTWTVPDGEPASAEAMYRFDTATAAARLGFTSPDGRARLLAKATEWFRDSIVGEPALATTGRGLTWRP